MKKYPAFAVCFLFLILCSCTTGKQIETKEAKGDISFFDNMEEAFFEVKIGKLDATGTLSFTDGQLTVEMFSPESMKGLKCSTDGKMLSVEHNGLKTEKSANSFSKKMFPKALYEALEEIKNKTAEVFENKITGNTPSGKYLFTLDDDGIYLISLCDGFIELTLEKEE